MLSIILTVALGCQAVNEGWVAMSSILSYEVQLQFVSEGFSVSEDAIILSIEPNGDINDLDGHPVLDKELSPFLRRCQGLKRTLQVKVMLADKSRTTIVTLGKVIEKFNKAVQPGLHLQLLIAVFEK